MKPSSTTSSSTIRKIQYSLTIYIILFKIIYLSLNQFHCRYRFEHLFLTHLWTNGQQSPWACSVRPVIPAVHSCCWRLLAVFLWLGTRSGRAARILEYLILFDRSRSMWSDKSCLALFPPLLLYMIFHFGILLGYCDAWRQRSCRNFRGKCIYDGSYGASTASRHEACWTCTIEVAFNQLQTGPRTPRRRLLPFQDRDTTKKIELRKADEKAWVKKINQYMCSLQVFLELW